jgi:hypothetical protein
MERTSEPHAGGGTEPPDPVAADEGQAVAVEMSAVRAVMDLLDLLSDVPSTPQTLAGVSAELTASLSRRLPPGAGLASHGRGTVDVPARSLAAVAGLLVRFGELGSTPPVVADDARSWAAQLWERLEIAEPPAGHRKTG